MMMFRGMLLAILLALAGCVDAPDHAVDKGDALPPMKLHDLTGTTLYSEELFSGKVVIFNVWATWCPPCREEMPDLIRLSHTLPAEKFMIVALSVDQDPNDVRAFVEEHRLDFPVFIDPGGKELAEPKLGITRYPETLVINRDGKVVTKVVGAYPWADEGTVRALKYIALHGQLPDK